MQPLRGLVDAETWAEALRRLIDERIDVNVGMMGISRPRGDAFLKEYAELMERGRAQRVPLLDEMLTVALLPKHRHFLADESWNCPADDYFRRTNLADARVIHYFADGQKVQGVRLGRNGATWAGRKWHEAYRRAARRIDLGRWEQLDRGFLRLERQLAATSGRERRLRRGGYRALRSRVRRAVTRTARSVLDRCHHRALQGWLWALARCGYSVSSEGPARATVIVLSYKRMANIEPIVRSALMCRFVERVIVSNNNPDVDLGPYLPRRDPRLVLIQQQQRRGPSYRYDLARQFPSEHYICIDDDVFPSPWQLTRMFELLLADPSVPRGIDGQVFDGHKGRLVNAKPRRRADRVGTQPVDIILQTYLFTRAHLDRYFELVAAMGKQNDEIHSSEDVILSRAGVGRPVVDHVGFLFECPSARMPGVATWSRDGFDSFRLELFHKLIEVR